MSITNEITRLQSAKAALKQKIETAFSVSIPSSDTLDDYPDYFPSLTPPPTASGVYIKYLDGDYSDYNDYKGKTAVGVVLITNIVSLLIHKDEATGIPWGNGTYINNCFTSTSRSSVLADYGGKANTDALISQIGTSAQAAYWARYTCVYEDGSLGYLPSCGEMEQIRINSTNVNTALSLIGGTEISWRTRYYTCSDQYNTGNSWYWIYDRSLWDGYSATFATPYVRSVANYNHSN